VLVAALVLSMTIGAIAQVGCRSPVQMTARLLTIQPSDNRLIRELFYYDAQNSRFAAFEEIQQGDTFARYEFIIDYNTRLRYVIEYIPDNPTTCEVTRLPMGSQFRVIGVPDNATLAGAYTLGIRLNVNYYTDEFWQGGWAGSFTTSGCLPISIQMQTARHGYQMQDFYDIVLGITDPSVFIPPSVCRIPPIVPVALDFETRRTVSFKGTPTGLEYISQQLSSVEADITAIQALINKSTSQSEKELLLQEKIQLYKKSEQVREERLLVLRQRKQ